MTQLKKKCFHGPIRNDTTHQKQNLEFNVYILVTNYVKYSPEDTNKRLTQHIFESTA